MSEPPQGCYRYAVYYAPEPGTALESFGASWLGRDLMGKPVPRPMVEGVSAMELAALTASPRRYGFHGTLKPPFRLAEGRTETELEAALTALSWRLSIFRLPPLILASLGPFLALVPGQPCREILNLANECVTELDLFRAPPDPAERAKRMAAGLTPRQQALLDRWGYPYVFDEFRFHLTLTGPIEASERRDRVALSLQPLLASVTCEPEPVRSLCLLVEPWPGAPLELAKRFPLSGA